MMRTALFAALVMVAQLGRCHVGEAATVIVGSAANGGFGTPLSGGQNLVLGYTFTQPGESIVITATGTVDISGDIVGPDGIDLSRSVIIGPFTSAYTPLEEQLVDGGTPPPIADGSSVIPDVGALFGAFVPLALASDASFQPFDSDSVPVGIGSDALFLIGAGPFTFTAPGAGVLYLGFNEPFVSNNSGAFTVDLSPAAVPEPASLALLGLGAVGVIGSVARRHRS